MQAVNPANIAMMNCNRKWKSRGKWFVCARKEEIIGLVKPLLPKPTMKPRVTITVIPLVSLLITCAYSTNAIIVLFKVSCYTGSMGCT